MWNTLFFENGCFVFSYCIDAGADADTDKAVLNEEGQGSVFYLHVPCIVVYVVNKRKKIATEQIGILHTDNVH